MLNHIKLYPSLMACPVFQLKDYIKEVLELGVTCFHIDIMDGCYVPNFAMSPAIIREILSIDPRITLQAHLMCQRPQVVYDNFIQDHDKIECFIHPDQQSADRLLSLDNVFSTFDLWDLPENSMQCKNSRLAMAVPVGFCGQDRSFDLEKALGSITDLSQITLDGGLKYEDCHLLKKYPIKAVVIGSGIFNQSDSPVQMTKKILQALGA